MLNPEIRNRNISIRCCLSRQFGTNRGSSARSPRGQREPAYRFATETVAVAVFVGSLSEKALSVTFAEAELSASGVA